MKRREFLRAAGLGAATFMGAPLLRHAGARALAGAAGNALRIPSIFTGGELVAAATRAEVWPGTMTDLMTLGGSWPAPTIRVRRGDRFDVRLVNRLDEPTIVHWHGLVVPDYMDGHPMDAMAPGGSFDYSFEVVNRAGTYWYHPHPHGRTAPQVYMGMAGLLVVEDDEEQALDLPRGAYDVPLVIQDRYLVGARSFTYAPTSAQRLNGMLGDTAFVNGTPDAELAVDAGLYRFRVLNGANARIFRLGFDDGRTFSVIAGDGGLLDRPYDVTETRLAPGERVEIVVDFRDLAAGESVRLSSLAYGTATTPGQQGYAMPVMTFTGTGATGHTRELPDALATLEPIGELPDAQQTFLFDTSPIPIGGHHHRINGEVFDMERSIAETAVDRAEVWELRNMHTMPHPIHIHGTQFRVLDRDGTTPADPRDLGWKDTVQLDGKESARVLVRFALSGRYLLHCHNLEHEDDGMMVNFTVAAPTGVDATGELSPTELDLR